MKNLKIYCVTNKMSKFLEQLPFQLVGVGTEKFSNKYIDCKIKKNIQKKEKNYSELTFHYWFWKNQLPLLKKNIWIGFCQKRRFWVYDNTNIKNFSDLKKKLLTNIPKEWEKFESLICNPIDVSNPKKIKVLKRGIKNLIKDPSILFIKNKQSIKLHFDMHHGYGVLDKAIDFMNNNDKDEFRYFVNNHSIFNPHIMCISKKDILNKWFKDLFTWLFKCERVFGIKNLKGYDQQRLYAYLAERYLPFWFKKYTKYREQNWIFFDVINE